MQTHICHEKSEDDIKCCIIVAFIATRKHTRTIRPNKVVIKGLNKRADNADKQPDKARPSRTHRSGQGGGADRTDKAWTGQGECKLCWEQQGFGQRTARGD